MKKEKEAFENLVREKAVRPISSFISEKVSLSLSARQSMVIPEEREGRDEYNPLLNRDPTPANQQAYGSGAATTIDQSDTRRGGLMPMTTMSNIRPKVREKLSKFREELSL